MTFPEDFIIEHRGGACPYQAEGSFGDDRFYFRYRSDNASLAVGPAEEKPAKPWYPLMPAHPPRLYAEIFGVFDDPFRGYLSREEADELIERLISMLKPPEEWEHGTHTDRLIAYFDALDKIKNDRQQAAKTDDQGTDASDGRGLHRCVQDDRCLVGAEPEGNLSEEGEVECWR